jgi:hypothetical protein
MANNQQGKANYWKILAGAAEALERGDFAEAERLYHDAAGRRDRSPGRVFFSEKLTDGFRSLLRHSTVRDGSAGPQPGRWQQSTAELHARFLAQGERVVREGIRVAELRPEDDPATNQPVLEAALFLVARSRIFQEEPSSAVPLLKGLFRTASLTGRPFDFQLVRHDLPLTEEDRLWLARQGGALFDVFIERQVLLPGSQEAEQWARVVLQLLQPRYFGASSRMEEERSWLEAVTGDRLLGRASASVELYRAYLGIGPVTGPRVDEARTRLVELLANIDANHFPVPRYAEALAALPPDGIVPGADLAPRLEIAEARISFRRPALGQVEDSSLAWASLALSADGCITVVFWWGDEPRDAATWRQGEETSTLAEFLAPCEGRLVAYDAHVLPFVRSAWAEGPAPWTVRDFLVAVMENRLPENGVDQETLLGLCLAETGPWRAGYDTLAGHPALEPPQSSTLLETWQSGSMAAALLAGLGWLAVRNRVVGGDPALGSGICELARRGDAAAKFLRPFLEMASAEEARPGPFFQPWTLPLLWTRPDPFGWTTASATVRSESTVTSEQGVRLDLGRNDLAIVTTGEPMTVMSAWGDGNQRWRVVLDRLERLESLASVAAGALGPVTLIPPAGTVHSLAAALEFLESLLTEVRPEQDALLPIFHWLRLVETHNGDLLDFRQVRPRPVGAYPLYDRYAAVADTLPREEPVADENAPPDSWAGQFSQRVRKAGLVAGPVEHLAIASDRLDSLWGVFEGGDASWVFLDSAAIHWELLGREEADIQEIHALLHSRGRRHLSLLTGSVWLRSELENHLASWLQVFGNPYCLTLTDCRPPALRLADRGIQPEANLLAATGLASQATWVDRAFADTGGGFIQLPCGGRDGAFWQAVRAGEIAIAGPEWVFLPANDESGPCPQANGLLVVPSLVSLSAESVPVPASDSRAEWTRADSERRAHFARCRRSCSLEIASYLAGPWEGVAILDTRWWRILLPDLPREQIGPGDRLDQGQLAVRLATEGMAQTLDLPGSDPRGRYPVDGRIQNLVDSWLRTKCPEPWHITSAETPGERSDGHGHLEGVNLLVGDVTETWGAILGRLTARWEQGRVEDWLLLVSDNLPSGATDLVAAAQVAGLSIWSADQTGQVPAPVVWVEPEDFGDPGLGVFLQANPPVAVVAGDVSEWRPGPDRESLETAFALRSVLDCGAKTVLLHAGQLDRAWVRFLTGACGARLVSPDDQSLPSGIPGGEVNIEASCLDCGGVGEASGVVRRLGALLRRLREIAMPLAPGRVEAETRPLPPGRQLLPLNWLAHLAGTTGTDVAQGVRLLRWAARLAGDPLSSAGSQRPVGHRRSEGHSLLIPHRFVDLEKSLIQLEANLGVLLPLWLGRGRPGWLNWMDLDYPPARIEPNDLELLDRFLMWHGSFGEEELGLRSESSLGLVYSCPRGMLHSTQRLLGCLQPSAEVLHELRWRLQVFRDRIEEVMAGALETGDGFLVETGLHDLRAEENSFLGLGSILGFWRWFGPPCQGAVHLVDLLTLADSPTVRTGKQGWELVRSAALDRYPEGDAPAPTTPVSSVAESGRGLRSLRSLLAGGGEQRDDLDGVVDAIADLASGGEARSFLVLKGVFGSGRHEALGRGLLKARSLAGQFPETTIFCPDEAVAAMVSREFLRLGLSGPLDVKVAHEEQHRPEAAGRNSLADPATALVVICEAQRFEPEMRYRIAQSGRERRLLMTVDPVAAVEPWEHLFLTTPRTDDILNLPGQRKAARKLWSEIRQLVPFEYREGNSLRRTKGMIVSDYAANLDQCLSRVVHEHQAGKLSLPLRVTAPMPGDLEYLGSSIRDRGWLAVLETRLESLLLPGPREILAAATDMLALGGHLNLDAQPARPSPESTAGTDIANEHSCDLLTPLLLGPGGAADWKSWIEEQEVTREITLNQFTEMVAPSRWANTFLSRPAARGRIHRLLEQYGEEQLDALRTLPLWEAWWYCLLDDLAVTGPRYRRPLALLTSAARPLGAAMPGAAYLCLGTEPVRQHYESLIRVTDSLLVLYQEKSPLPSEVAG